MLVQGLELEFRSSGGSGNNFFALCNDWELTGNTNLAPKFYPYPNSKLPLFSQGSSLERCQTGKRAKLQQLKLSRTRRCCHLRHLKRFTLEALQDQQMPFLTALENFNDQQTLKFAGFEAVQDQQTL